MHTVGLAHAETQALIERLRNCADFKVLERLPELQGRVLGPEPVMPLKAVLLDTETTGTDLATDLIIELGMVAFEFCGLSGEIHRVLGTFSALEDPGFPIPPEATRVNGITDEMVAGKRIEGHEVAAFLEDTALVIAHNARFDRPFVEKRFAFFEPLHWACSMSQVPWAELGIGGTKLEYLAFRQGFFFEAHRADRDCLALFEVLRRPVEGQVPFKALYENAWGITERIWATGAPYAGKDVLKSRGYRWNDGVDGRPKAWYLDTAPETVSTELEVLAGHVFKGKPFCVELERFDATVRHSSRRGTVQRCTREGLSLPL